MANIKKLKEVYNVIADIRRKFCYKGIGKIDLNDCDTIGCVVGYTLALYPETPPVHLKLSTAQEYLEITLEEAEFLFRPSTQENFPKNYLNHYPNLRTIDYEYVSEYIGKAEALSRLDWIILHHSTIYPYLNKKNIQKLLNYTQSKPENFNYRWINTTPFSSKKTHCGCVLGKSLKLWNKDTSITLGLTDQQVVWLTLPNQLNDIFPMYKPTTNLPYTLMEQLPDKGFAEAVNRLEYLLTLPTE
jgi:hypothetical protein